MGFLAPFAPLIGGAIGGILGGRKSNLEKQIANKINPSLENLMNWAGMAQGKQAGLEGMRDKFAGMTGQYDALTQDYEGRSQGYEPIALGDVGRASQFYNKLLSPSSSEALNEILGPQRQGLMQNYNNMIQTGGRTGARGGGRTSGLMDFEFAKNRDFINLVPQARMMAAQGLLGTSGLAGQQSDRLSRTGQNYGQLGQGYGQLGLGFGSQALGYGNLAGSLTGQVLGFANPALAQQSNERLNRGSEWGQIGGGIGSLLGPLLSGLGQKKSGLPELKF